MLVLKVYPKFYDVEMGTWTELWRGNQLLWGRYARQIRELLVASGLLFEYYEMDGKP